MPAVLCSISISTRLKRQGWATQCTQEQALVVGLHDVGHVARLELRRGGAAPSKALWILALGTGRTHKNGTLTPDVRRVHRTAAKHKFNA